MMLYPENAISGLYVEKQGYLPKIYNVERDKIKNVKDLKVAWTFRTGDFRTENDSGETTNQVTPIKIGNNMYIGLTHYYL
jgi:glucose dehydrogenase